MDNCCDHGLLRWKCLICKWLPAKYHKSLISLLKIGIDS